MKDRKQEPNRSRQYDDNALEGYLGELIKKITTIETVCVMNAHYEQGNDGNPILRAIPKIKLDDSFPEWVKEYKASVIIDRSTAPISYIIGVRSLKALLENTNSAPGGRTGGNEHDYFIRCLTAFLKTKIPAQNHTPPQTTLLKQSSNKQSHHIASPLPSYYTDAYADSHSEKTINKPQRHPHQAYTSIPASLPPLQTPLAAPSYTPPVIAVQQQQPLYYTSTPASLPPLQPPLAASSYPPHMITVQQQQLPQAYIPMPASSQPMLIETAIAQTHAHPAHQAEEVVTSPPNNNIHGQFLDLVRSVEEAFPSRTMFFSLHMAGGGQFTAYENEITPLKDWRKQIKKTIQNAGNDGLTRHLIADQLSSFMDTLRKVFNDVKEKKPCPSQLIGTIRNLAQQVITMMPHSTRATMLVSEIDQLEEQRFQSMAPNRRL